MKNTRETKMVFSNINSNKKKAENKSASKSDELFDYDNEVVIGLKISPKPKTPKLERNEKNYNLRKKVKHNKINKNSSNIKTKNNSNIETKKNSNIKSKNKNLNRKHNNKNRSLKSKNSPTKIINDKFKKLIIQLTKWSMLIIILIGGLIYFLLSPIFNVKNINVNGNQNISTETIISLSGISINNNIIKIRKSDVKKNISQNAYIENVEISKKLSNTLEINIKERTVSFMIKLGEGYVYINNQGYILEVSNEKLNFPIIIGQATDNSSLVTGNRLNNEDLKKLEMVLKIRDVAQSNDLGGIITGIDITDDENYKIIFENENKIAYIGDCSNLSTRILYVKSILQQEQLKSGEIFVNMDLNKQYPFFREKV